MGPIVTFLLGCAEPPTLEPDWSLGGCVVEAAVTIDSVDAQDVELACTGTVAGPAYPDWWVTGWDCREPSGDTSTEAASFTDEGCELTWEETTRYESTGFERRRSRVNTCDALGNFESVEEEGSSRSAGADWEVEDQTSLAYTNTYEGSRLVAQGWEGTSSWPYGAFEEVEGRTDWTWEDGHVVAWATEERSGDSEQRSTGEWTWEDGHLVAERTWEASGERETWTTTTWEYDELGRLLREVQDEREDGVPSRITTWTWRGDSPWVSRVDIDYSSPYAGSDWTEVYDYRCP